MRPALHVLSFACSFTLAAGAIAWVASTSAFATPTYATAWAGKYPASTSITNVSQGTGSACALCHFSANGGGNWNPYGWKVRQGIQAGQSILTALANAEGFNSDADPTASSNLVEITAGTQPGWTPGAANTRYTTSSSTSGQTPLAGILGSLDPVATPATNFCFGDGTGTACPCANSGSAGNGCANSLGANGAHLAASGRASVSADTWLLTGTGVPNGPGLYYQGVNQLGGGLGVTFGDGLRCIGGSVFRLGIVLAASNTSTYPSGTTSPNNIPISIKGVVAPGTLHYQLWYRDSDPVFCSASVFNLTNALSVTWIP